MIKNIWEGIYTHFAEVPESDDGHQGSAWTTNSRAKIMSLLHAQRQSKSIPSEPAYTTSLLPLVAAMVADARGSAAILDFGGGPGFTFVPVASAMPDPSNIAYHVVDTEPVCRTGIEVFAGDERIHFHTSLPQDTGGIDIVHLGSSLHYIDDWKGLIEKLSSYKPAYFIVTDLPAGDIPTYVTAQNYYGSKMPVRFFNIDEIYAAMRHAGFRLLFRSRFRGTYFGTVQSMPQDNFPTELRLGDTCSLVFATS